MVEDSVRQGWIENNVDFLLKPNSSYQIGFAEDVTSSLSDQTVSVFLDSVSSEDAQVAYEDYKSHPNISDRQFLEQLAVKNAVTQINEGSASGYGGYLLETLNLTFNSDTGTFSESTEKKPIAYVDINNGKVTMRDAAEVEQNNATIPGLRITTPLSDRRVILNYKIKGENYTIGVWLGVDEVF
ncbi:hypothetical protein N780_13480 [Pontibacillus chungwhensis BH030062]|uniref:Uncharacterized protein n=1 Tax=Pontibacillus chungwhensis BH030062 TaxID=1385513 RepID=A0A0A2V1P2_9BACI|nr:hypothetical protein [Pontibacillus chungwhensis]KGP92731.1 hypothetical protein N780_13480 [Pontibacillus chungwhensis BH030062]